MAKYPVWARIRLLNFHNNKQAATCVWLPTFIALWWSRALLALRGHSCLSLFCSLTQGTACAACIPPISTWARFQLVQPTEVFLGGRNQNIPPFLFQVIFLSRACFLSGSKCWPWTGPPQFQLPLGDSGWWVPVKMSTFFVQPRGLTGVAVVVSSAHFRRASLKWDHWGASYKEILTLRVEQVQ